MYQLIYSYKGKEEIICENESKKEIALLEDNYRKIYKLDGIVEDCYVKEVKEGE